MASPIFIGPNTQTFFIMFLSIYIFAYLVLFKNWPGKRVRGEATSCVVSLLHGTPAVIMAIHALLNSSNPNSFASPNTNVQNRVLEFSMAYFLMDLLHYMVFCPDEVLFILHHLATLYVFMTCRYAVGHGAYGLLVLLALAEVTSASQNVWTLAKMMKDDVEFARRLYEFLSAPFYAYYSFVRGVLGPLFVAKLAVFYFGGGGARLVPVWAWISWLVVIVVAVLVGILWVWNLWTLWYKERSLVLNKVN